MSYYMNMTLFFRICTFLKNMHLCKMDIPNDEYQFN